MSSSSNKAHLHHTNADTQFAIQKLTQGYTRDEVVSLLVTERSLGMKGAITCVEQILWGQARGDKTKEHEISEWSQGERKKADKYMEAAKTLVSLSKNTSGSSSSSGAKKGGKSKGTKRKGNKKRKVSRKQK
jgi:hypothetical protein